jgi:TolB-like protein
MAEPDNLGIKIQLERILSSAVFKKSNVLTCFLRYVVTETIEGRVNEIKEYSIAVNAFGKSPDFNPQMDAATRIHAGRLRRSLLEYYQGEGMTDTLIISLNKGSYVPVFVVKENRENIPEMEGTTSIGPGPVNRIAVLPFRNLSGLAENDFMVDGFCEQLSADLAQFPEITVIAYFSTSKFKAERPDIRKVGEELNASHLITGSVYRDKKHLRISMQLVNTVDGSQLWTESYDRVIKTDYLYGIFDDIIKHVAPKLTGYYGLVSRNVGFSTQLDPLLDGDTVDAVFWYYHYQMLHTEKVFLIARSRLEKAVQLNPNYALAWAILAQLHIDGIAYLYAGVSNPIQEADKCVQRALQLFPNCQHAHLSMSWMCIFLRDKKGATEALERCISINPGSSFFLGAASFLFSLLSEYEKSIEYFNKSNILNPYCPWWVNLGPIFSHFHHGNYEQALQFANRIYMPGLFWSPIFRIAALAKSSREKEARELAGNFLLEFPGKAATADIIIQKVLFDDLAYDRIKEGLKSAGLPV